MVGTYLLGAQRQIEALREEHLRLGGEIHLLCPIILLVCQSGTIEQSSLKDYRYTDIETVAEGGTDVAHVTHLLGDERTVGKILLVRRTMGIDSERHSHLTDCERETRSRLDACIGIEHLDLSLVA